MPESEPAGAGEWVHYAASKGAINSFTLGLAREVAGEGVRVNLACASVQKNLRASASLW
jgi:NAD(P)-dependent dehydrogenase (short-subunit alcohol dehydrogenase family)